MIYLNTFLYYAFFASAVLLYGIGLNKISEIGTVKFKNIIFYIKCGISIISSAVISWLLIHYLLVPLKIIELYPLICFIVYVCISSFLSAIINLTTGQTTTEFSISYMIILLSIGESTSLLLTLVISLSCIVALTAIIPFSLTFKRRICSNGHLLDESFYSVYFIFLAILILLISAGDINWLNPGVIK